MWAAAAGAVTPESRDWLCQIFVFLKYLANSLGPNSLSLSLTVILSEIESKLRETCVICVTTYDCVSFKSCQSAVWGSVKGLKTTISDGNSASLDRLERLRTRFNCILFRTKLIMISTPIIHQLASYDVYKVEDDKAAKKYEYRRQNKCNILASIDKLTTTLIKVLRCPIYSSHTASEISLQYYLNQICQNRIVLFLVLIHHEVYIYCQLNQEPNQSLNGEIY